MRIIIAGSRNFEDYPMLETEVDRWIEQLRTAEDSEIILVSGRARGADLLGERYANIKRYPQAMFPANWDGEGRQAGFRRNRRMAEFATHLIAFWDGDSRGTANMVAEANRLALVVKIVNFKFEPYSLGRAVVRKRPA